MKGGSVADGAAPGEPLLLYTSPLMLSKLESANTGNSRAEAIENRTTSAGLYMRRRRTSNGRSNGDRTRRRRQTNRDEPEARRLLRRSWKTWQSMRSRATVSDEQQRDEYLDLLQRTGRISRITGSGRTRHGR